MLNRLKSCKSILLLLLVLGSLIPANAQTKGPKSLFWVISGNGLEKPSHLYGTIHLMPKKQFRMYDILEEKLKASDQLILEMEIDVPFKTQLEWAKQMMLPEGKDISDFTDVERFEKLKSYAIDSLSIKEGRFNIYIKMKPFAFFSALIPEILDEKIESYEMHFSKLAKKEDIPVKPLETFEFQMSIFDSIPNEKQMDMFFDEEMDFRKDYQELLEQYIDQDIYALAQSYKDDENYAGIEQELIIMRNHDWADKLDEYLHEKSSFIAVGAGHLAGKEGLIRLLREKGYRVDPVMLH